VDRGTLNGNPGYLHFTEMKTAPDNVTHGAISPAIPDHVTIFSGRELAFTFAICYCRSVSRLSIVTTVLLKCFYSALSIHLHTVFHM